MAATGTTTPTYAWQRSTDGGATWTTLGGTSGFEGSTSSTLVVTAGAQVTGERFRVVVTNAGGAVASDPATLKVLAEPTARLPNLSVRTTLNAGQNLAVGFVSVGGAKPMLVRAVGPQLSQFGITTAMADPHINFYNAAGVKTAENDDWLASDGALFTQLGAFPLDDGSKDAALQISLAGPSSVQIEGPTAGTVLVEVYDIGTDNHQRLSNVSARNLVGTGDDILIAGFVIDGADPKNVLIRGVGPTLADFGVTGVLADPQLQVFTSAGGLVAQNDDWNASLTPAFTVTGAFSLPAGSKDAALIITLPPGAYSAQVRGADGGTGEALVEIYELP